MHDPTETIRRERLVEINAMPGSRETLEARYSRRSGATGAPSKPRTSMSSSSKPAGPITVILDGVRALGLASATDRQVAQAIRELFPTGTANTEPGEVIRAVFVHLMRQNPADSVGR